MTLKTYKEAVSRGDYNIYVGNLFGKYDNVRTYWEDQLTRYIFRPFLEEVVNRKKKQKEKVRIVDLGSGSGQSFELLTKIEKHVAHLGHTYEWLLPEEDIELFLGLDISKEMVEKGTENYAAKSNVQFIEADLRNGLGEVKNEPAFDIYFSSYSSLSHINRSELKRLIGDICNHCKDEAIVVMDLLGRYSLEWPCYWDAKTEDQKVRDYSMSYLYAGIDKSAVEIERFPMRFWTGKEVDEFAKELSSELGVQVEVLKKFDRSILVGRHMDTKEYNPNVRPIRRFINLLHTDYMRTDLRKLILDPKIVPEHPIAGPFLRELIKSCGVLIKYCNDKLNNQSVSLKDLTSEWSTYSPHLQFTLMTMDRVISGTSWMWYGEPRANIIEPQLSYGLRSLEFSMQNGLGCGHALLAVLKIKK